ncbi:uncharacterized protein LOC105281282 isoform X2 [Ooceraea biroi]|uniref:uncharacterized protein LOC105281282 isoform X2 n=1 Tax=Ooceraea biroi TaxID=2015173 RepID=UPI0005BC8D35|nr:uncharacterized protein LOC105281282 isoform X2 [Ooceraea biroi]
MHIDRFIRCLLSRRRLKRDAVPSILQMNSQTDQTNLHTSMESPKIVENSQADQTNLHTSMESSEIIENSQSDHINDMNKTKKRKLTTSLLSRKRFKVTINNQSEWLSRNDCTSQKSWEKFLYFVQSTRMHKNTVLHRDRRMKKRTIRNIPAYSGSTRSCGTNRYDWTLLIQETNHSRSTST